MERSPERGLRARILIVDDREDNIVILKSRLESWGYETETARDGLEALRRIDARPPDLVLLDIMMPQLDGIEVARRVKGNPSLPFIPIIMQTALDSTENKIEGLEAGADDYITKPIDFPELRARLRSMLRIKRLRDQVDERERELLEANERLRIISQTDGLTSLDNRRYLEQRLEEIFAHARRLNEALSCVMCDLDHFKEVNDSFGHQSGDSVLRQFGRILRHEVREVDRVGRYGGDEFMLVLPGAAAEPALRMAERVRRQVESHTFIFGGSTLRRTASFGVATWPHPDVTDAEALVRAADGALYVAKKNGRNRVTGFDSGEFNLHVVHTTHPTHTSADDRADQHSGASDRGTQWAG